MRATVGSARSARGDRAHPEGARRGWRGRRGAATLAACAARRRFVAVLVGRSGARSRPPARRPDRDGARQREPASGSRRGRDPARLRRAARSARNLTNERGEYHVVRARRGAHARASCASASAARDSAPAALPERIARLDVAMFALPSLIQPVRVRGELALQVAQGPRGRARPVGAGTGRPARDDRRARGESGEGASGSDSTSIMDGNSDRIEAMRVRERLGRHARRRRTSRRTPPPISSGSDFRPTASRARPISVPTPTCCSATAFAGAYCFELAAPVRSRPNQVGLRFVPADHRKGRVDIDGTLWIDTVARELRDVEFRYLNVERAPCDSIPAATCRSGR